MSPVVAAAFVAAAFVAAAAVAALARSGIAGRLNGTFPAGTLVVNVTGSLALGVVAGALDGADAGLVVGTAFLGTFTTFSTFARDAADLALVRRRWGLATAYVVGTIAACVGAAWIGLVVGGG